MGIRRTYRNTFVGMAAVGLVAVGYGSAMGDTGGHATGPDHAPTGTAMAAVAASEAAGDEESTLELKDGRKVTVRLVKGTGVQERHQAAGAGTWSKWKTLYKTRTDLCQGVDLAEVNGTVSLIADFGLYCYDGEPPTESVAGVAQGDLTDWDINITKDFDGWGDTSINDDGSRVLFVYDSDAGLYYLRWAQGEGFGKVVPPKK